MLSKNQQTKASKFLSLVLRHKPETISLELDENGWALVNDLLQGFNEHDFNLTIDNLKFLVESSDKKRFAFTEDFSKIRASQGHSINVNLELKEHAPPAFLFHGTAVKNINSIKEKGLLKRERHHVHLSEDKTTASSIGSRYGKPIVLKVDTKTMHDEDIPFFKSENNVWLTDHVPAKHIDFDDQA